MAKFNFQKNREMIEEYVDIVCSLEEYAKAWEGMAERAANDGERERYDEMVRRVKKTLGKYNEKLKACHSEEREYFNGNRRG